MTTTPTPAAPSDRDPTVVGPPTDRSDGTPGTAGGDIARLNAFDGLFLRAEHLTEMQDYARDLAHAVGAAGGPGVVDGYDVTSTKEGLRVDAGLAVSAAGRPLRSRRVVMLPWGTFPRPPTDGWFRIEIGPADWGFGEATVQALLCDAPCTGGTRATVHRAEGVVVHVVTDSEAGFGGATGRRGWLASLLFAREEKAAAAWPRPGRAHLADLSWRPPPAGALAERVPLAVVIPDGADPQTWTVDVWSVRRDRGAPPPDDLWRWRLAMRPWAVFVAQVLQFQDHYAAAALPGHLRAMLTAVTLEAELTTILAEVGRQRTAAPAQQLTELIARIRGAEPGPGAEFGKLAALPDVGITELPPAGLLVVHPRTAEGEGDLDDAVREEVDRLLAGGADLRVRRCGPDDVGSAFEQARHRRRIPIGDPAHAPVDVLLPVDEGKWVGDWVAFVRRDGTVDRPPEPPVEQVDEVDVFLVDDGTDREKFTRDVAAVQAGKLPDGVDAPAAVLRYPRDTWAQPLGDQRALLEKILGQGTRIVVAAFVADASRRAVGVVRAGLLTIRFGGATSGGSVLPQLFSATGTPRDAIVVIGLTELN